MRTTAYGGTPSASEGADAYSYYIDLYNGLASQVTFEYNGVAPYQYSSALMTSGSGEPYPFYLDATDGSPASISGTTATFDFVSRIPNLARI